MFWACVLCSLVQKAVASYFLNKPVEISPSYEGKAFLEIDIRAGTSKLRLTQLTMKDSRLYQCSVRIYGDDDGTTAATTSLLVLGKSWHRDKVYFSFWVAHKHLVKISTTVHPNRGLIVSHIVCSICRTFKAISWTKYKNQIQFVVSVIMIKNKNKNNVK